MSQKTRKSSRDFSGYYDNLSPEEQARMQDASPLKGLTPVTAENILNSAFHKVSVVESEAAATGQVVDVPVSDIEPSPWQPRTVFDKESIATLAANIQESGLLQPIVVRRQADGAGVRFHLVAGERRLRAHKLLEAESIKALVVEMTDEQMAFAGLAENLARESLTGYEVFQAIHRLEKGFESRTELAKSLGISRTQLYRFMSFERLPKFLTDELQEDPSLLSPRTAELITSIAANIGSEIVEPILKQLWTFFRDGKITSAEIPNLLNSRLSRRVRTTTVVNTLSEFYVKGSKVGNFKRRGDQLTLSVGLQGLTEEQEALVERYLSVGLKEMLASMPTTAIKNIEEPAT